MSTVAVLGDAHCPYMIPGYFDFYYDVCEAYGADTFHSIGDLIDLHAVNFHAKEHGYENLSKELDEAREQIKRLHNMFPNMSVNIGNHDALIQRQAASVGLTEDLLRPLDEILDVPGWNFIPRFKDYEIDGVLYRHGDQSGGGEKSAINAAVEWNQSVVQGHLHRQCSISYKHTRGDRPVFGMQVGCGVDWESAVQNYGRNFKFKPFISVGIVVDGERPIIEMMPRGKYLGY